jgi:hypothetical protein
MADTSLEYVKEMITKGNVEGAVKSLAAILQSNKRDIGAWLLLANIIIVSICICSFLVFVLMQVNQLAGQLLPNVALTAAPYAQTEKNSSRTGTRL